jgi:hypothetical protein
VQCWKPFMIRYSENACGDLWTTPLTTFLPAACAGLCCTHVVAWQLLLCKVWLLGNLFAMEALLFPNRV